MNWVRNNRFLASFLAVVLLASTADLSWSDPLLVVYELAVGAVLGAVLGRLGAAGLSRAAGLFPGTLSRGRARRADPPIVRIRVAPSGRVLCSSQFQIALRAGEGPQSGVIGRKAESRT